MKTLRLSTALLLTCTTLAGCGERAESDSSVVETPSWTTQTTPAGEPVPVTASAPAPKADLHAALRQRLLALNYYAERMWAVDQPEAPRAWLAESAAEYGVTLAGIMPEPVAVAESVATVRLRVRAEGEWDALLNWLSAIEDSPRRFMARGIALHRLRGRSVADLQLTALMDRPAALQAMAQLDLASLDDAGLAGLIEEMDADLRQKGQTLDRLGADVSWARPIAQVTESLPEAGVLIRLNLDRGHLDARARRFAGAFTAQVRTADEVDPMVAELNTTEGFAEAKLTGGRDVGAGIRRADVAFTYGHPAAANPAAPTEEAGHPVANDSGAGLRHDPFREVTRRAAAQSTAQAQRPRRGGNVLLSAPSVAGGRSGIGPRGPRSASSRQFTSSAGFTNGSRFTQNSGFTRSSGFTDNSGFTNGSRFTSTSGFANRSSFTGNTRFTGGGPRTPSTSFTRNGGAVSESSRSRGAATPTGPRSTTSTTLPQFRFDATR